LPPKPNAPWSRPKLEMHPVLVQGLCTRRMQKVALSLSSIGPSALLRVHHFIVCILFMLLSSERIGSAQASKRPVTGHQVTKISDQKSELVRIKE
ncbi:MAG: hypothetical protein ACUVSU_04595, partial [Aggregatilineaceae bacterium]